MVLRLLMLFSLFLMSFAGCGGGNGTTPAAPAAIRLEAASVGTDSSGNDTVTVTATVTDAAGRPVSGRVEVRAFVAIAAPNPNPYSGLPQMFPGSQALPTQTISALSGTSDENGQLSVPIPIEYPVPTMIAATAGTVTSNTISVSRSGDPSATALVAVFPSSGVYAVNCYGFAGVAGAEIAMSYDLAAASGPVIQMGAFGPNAQMVSHADETTGSLRMAFITPYPTSLSGAGTIATVFFGHETTAWPGTLSSLQVTLLDVTATPIPVRTLLIDSY